MLQFGERQSSSETRMLGPFLSVLLVVAMITPF
jgi:hypothetical protein